jgi:hypothetical protein
MSRTTADIVADLLLPRTCIVDKSGMVIDHVHWPDPLDVEAADRLIELDKLRSAVEEASEATP